MDGVEEGFLLLLIPSFKILYDIEQFLVPAGDAGFLVYMLHVSDHGAFCKKEPVAYKRYRPALYE
ncbi:MAG: hypothetical protein Q4E04_04580 [Slackia piriformis]|nr:hypothetical protein [Slackia piriformis]MDO5024048.1 hypothetical protein [Slackia piriformis]